MTQYTNTLGAGILTRQLSVEVAQQSPQASIIKAELGPEKAGAIVVSAIREACLLTGSNLVPELQAMIAKSILNDYWFMKIDEVFLVIAEGIKGRFAEPGKPAIYGQLNLQTIYGWLEKYDMERMNKIEGEHETHKGEWGNRSDRSPEPKLAKDIFTEAVDKDVRMRIDAYKRRVEENEDY